MAGTGKDSAPLVIAVSGEAATRTSIPVVRDRRASRGRYLALMAGREAPGGSGWFAAYRVRTPEAGVYALTAVAAAPVETTRVGTVASYMRLHVNDGPYTEVVAFSPSRWYESRPAWGDLSVRDFGEVELRGESTVAFRVGEAVPVDDAVAYVFRLDHVTFTLRRPRAGRPVPREVSVAVHRHGHPAPPLCVRSRPRRPCASRALHGHRPSRAVCSRRTGDAACGEPDGQSRAVAELSPQPCRTPQLTLTANPSQYVRRPPCGTPTRVTAVRSDPRSRQDITPRNTRFPYGQCTGGPGHFTFRRSPLRLPWPGSGPARQAW